MLQVNKIYKNIEGKDILRDASLKLGRTKKAAIVGPNGVGKSTLLKIIIGEIKPDTGSILVNKGVRIGYLPQEIGIGAQSTETIETYLRNATGINELEKRMAEMEKKLSDEKSLSEYGELQEKFLAIDGYNFQARMSEVVEMLGLGDISKSRKLGMLSGGQKVKIALAGILLQNFDLLLLDEPTNNLDIRSIIWLENFLQKTELSCLIVSHDRRFLDNIISKVFEIDWYTKNIHEFSGSYSSYLNHQKKEKRRLEQEYETAQVEKNRLIISAKQKQDWGHKESSKNAKDNDTYAKGYRNDRTSSKSSGTMTSMKKRLKKLDEIERPWERPQLIIPLVANASPQKHEILLEDVSVNRKSFCLGPINLRAKYGAHIGIVGPNGSGKSTLLGLINGDIQPCHGKITIGNSLHIGNLTQAHENMLPEETIVDFFQRNNVEDRQRMFLMLAKLGIKAENVEKKISSLSPGERARVLMAFFSVNSVNVLLLDEPTNHLDVEAMEALEEALVDYSGTIIFVSHDRTFLEKINPSKLFVVKDGKLEALDGYTEYKKRLSL